MRPQEGQRIMHDLYQRAKLARHRLHELRAAGQATTLMGCIDTQIQLMSPSTIRRSIKAILASSMPVDYPEIHQAEGTDILAYTIEYLAQD